jgi:hypothetical protein
VRTAAVPEDHLERCSVGRLSGTVTLTLGETRRLDQGRPDGPLPLATWLSCDYRLLELVPPEN